MPLLYNSDYPDIDANRLNKAKKKINKSSLVQYTKLKQIQSTIQPTKAEIKSYFLQTIQILDKVKATENFINNNLFISFDISQKTLQETQQYLVEQSNFIIYNLTPNYNYFDPQQNQIIKQKLQNLIEMNIEILTLADDLLNEQYDIDDQIQMGTLLYEILNIIANTLIDPLNKLTQNYSPLKINIKPSESGLFEKVEGGYIGGSHQSFYPETRFL
jgi:hypothetical protein